VSLDGTELLALLEGSSALRRGHFLLSSGLHSAAYVQCALLLEDPRRARRVGEALAARLAPLRPESIVSPAMGGLLIGHEVAAALGVPFRFTERKGEAMGLHRGFQLKRGERVAIVEDVITTGKSTRETSDVVTALGAEIVAIGSIIDRSDRNDRSDGTADLFAVPYEALLRLDLGAFLPLQCPQCLAGAAPAEKPGSRPQPAG
jgi:orotate phosphoribosyltransferase